MQERNYSTLTFSATRKEYYDKVNSSEQKRIGDEGERIAKEWFESHGYIVRLSTPEEDAHQHVDLWIRKIGEYDWHSVDVKRKKEFAIEIVNHWGKSGWIFTGAEYIFQMFYDSTYWGDEMYLYRRADFVSYILQHIGIFADQYCKIYGKSKIWNLGKKRLATMNFIQKL